MACVTIQRSSLGVFSIRRHHHDMSPFARSSPPGDLLFDVFTAQSQCQIGLMMSNRMSPGNKPNWKSPDTLLNQMSPGTCHPKADIKVSPSVWHIATGLVSWGRQQVVVHPWISITGPASNADVHPWINVLGQMPILGTCDAMLSMRPTESLDLPS